MLFDSASEHLKLRSCLRKGRAQRDREFRGRSALNDETTLDGASVDVVAVRAHVTRCACAGLLRCLVERPHG